MSNVTRNNLPTIWYDIIKHMKYTEIVLLSKSINVQMIVLRDFYSNYIWTLLPDRFSTDKSIEGKKTIINVNRPKARGLANDEIF